MLELDSDQKTDGSNTGSSPNCGGSLKENIETNVPFIFLESALFQLNKVTLQVKMATET